MFGGLRGMVGMVCPLRGAILVTFVFCDFTFFCCHTTRSTVSGIPGRDLTLFFSQKRMSLVNILKNKDLLLNRSLGKILKND